MSSVTVNAAVVIVLVTVGVMMDAGRVISPVTVIVEAGGSRRS